MKKILLITIGIILLNILTLSVANAQECENDSGCTGGLKCLKKAKGDAKECQDPLGLLVPITCTKDTECKGGGKCTDGICQKPDKDTGAGAEDNPIATLPDVTSDDVFRTVIKTILGASMLLTIVAIVMAGSYYIQSQGQEEDITKAKNIILYLVIGMVIMAAAYGLVSGIIQFKFFDAIT